MIVECLVYIKNLNYDPLEVRLKFPFRPIKGDNIQSLILEQIENKKNEYRVNYKQWYKTIEAKNEVLVDEINIGNSVYITVWI